MMIQYDKNRIKDLAYVRELLEGKYIKADNNKNRTSIYFISKIQSLIIDKEQISCIDMDFSYVLVDQLQNITMIEESHYSFFRLAFKFFEENSFTTKEEFINNVNIIIKNIQKGVENE
jgi:hypothetical protein